MASRSYRPSAQQHGSSSSPSSARLSTSSRSSSSSTASDCSYQNNMDPYYLQTAPVQTLRCMRCTRTVESAPAGDMDSSGMVRVGLNIYYCHRCARLVGYK